MKIFKKKTELYQWNQAHSKQSIGFVPTMGALHQGHLSLVRAAKKECDQVVVSIFINKLQFGANEDFNQYPRSIEEDISQLKKEQVDVLFVPHQTDIYPNNFSFQIDEINISKKLEGVSRPDFFSGVMIVVLKLFNLVQPTFVYFGEKDIQQLCVIKKLIENFNFPITLRACPTVREQTGLAMSSRNKYLSKNDKKDAAILYRTLKKGKLLIKENETIEKIKKQMFELLTNKNITIEYLSIANLNTFEEIADNNTRPIVIAGAIYYKKIRLIDNVIIEK